MEIFCLKELLYCQITWLFYKTKFKDCLFNTIHLGSYMASYQKCPITDVSSQFVDIVVGALISTVGRAIFLKPESWPSRYSLSKFRFKNIIKERPFNIWVVLIELDRMSSLSVYKKVKADSHYTANLLRPAIDGCKIENFPIFRSDLQRPSPLRQSQRPATSVNEPLGCIW